MRHPARFTRFAAACLLLPFLLAFAHADERPHSVAASLRRSDSLFAMRQYRGAIAVLEAENQVHPGCADVLWRMACLEINIGDAAAREAREAQYAQAVAHAEAAVRADPRSANAHAYLAAAVGSHAMFAGGKEKVRLAHRIRDELDRALALDPDNQVAHSVYGTFHRAIGDVSWIERQLANVFLGGMPDGSFDESVRHLRRAIAVAPTVLRHRYELGRTYIAMDRDDLAVRAYRDALKCPPAWSTDDRRIREMRAFISEHGG